MTRWVDDFNRPVLTDTLPALSRDGVDTGPVCHRFDGDAAFAACRVPRSEQPAHGASAPAYVVAGQSHCPWCGNPICRRCREAIR